MSSFEYIPRDVQNIIFSYANPYWEAYRYCISDIKQLINVNYKWRLSAHIVPSTLRASLYDSYRWIHTKYAHEMMATVFVFPKIKEI